MQIFQIYNKYYFIKNDSINVYRLIEEQIFALAILFI